MNYFDNKYFVYGCLTHLNKVQYKYCCVVLSIKNKIVDIMIIYNIVKNKNL